ncbi:MAG: hypothetical protein E5Y02_22605 [Mesorhizobium sp.]|nr:MAG: hypothetical protein E5Y02_22605 [Mesorhizobium sp.]
MRKTIQLLLVASLCGCVAAAPRPVAGDQRGNPIPISPIPISPIPISLALEEIITGGIRQHLSDPASAKFGTMLAGERTLGGRQEIVACGTVSNRTSSRAYGDDKAFVAKIYPDAGSSFELVAMSDGSADSRLRVQGLCRAASLPVLEAGAKL